MLILTLTQTSPNRIPNPNLNPKFLTLALWHVSAPWTFGIVD